MDITKIMGSYYGSEIMMPGTGNFYWWNGSGWVLGRLPTDLRGSMDLCVRRKRIIEDDEEAAALTGQARECNGRNSGEAEQQALATLTTRQVSVTGPKGSISQTKT